MVIQEFLLRYVIFAIASLALLRFVYFRSTPNREAFIGMYMFGNGVFFITYLLHSVEMSMGFAFGLFAVFSMLRYRTEALGVRDMTYLFTTIVISLMCAVADVPSLYVAGLSGIIVILAAISETHVFAPTITERRIAYDRIDKIHPKHYQDLLAEVRERTGMNVVKLELGKVDFLNDSVQLTVFCKKGE